MSERTDATPTGDPLVTKSEEATIDARTASRAANLFDVRRIIGGLFAVYGVILTILGITASDADIDKAAGINVNLWAGLGMLALAALFIAWALLRPLAQQLDEPGEGDRTIKGAHAPTGPDAAALAGSKTTSRRTRRDGGGA